MRDSVEGLVRLLGSILRPSEGAPLHRPGPHMENKALTGRYGKSERKGPDSMMPGARYHSAKGPGVEQTSAGIVAEERAGRRSNLFVDSSAFAVLRRC